MSTPKVIAFYLPQFYPTVENDEWWGKGFTEWTNVGRAKPLFRGHYQPKVPADLGYYDLRISEVREQQVELAKEAGIDGFCYWHYWFNGRRLLDRVFREVVESGNPDFPFCLCWANHSWYQKTWDPSKPDKLLMEQTYGGVEDYIQHFRAMLPAFKDPRYLKQNGKLLFGVFAPLNFDDFEAFKLTWNELAKKESIPGFHFFAMTLDSSKIGVLEGRGYDSVVVDSVHYSWDNETLISRLINGIKKKWFKIPRTFDYSKYADVVVSLLDKYNFVPCIIPNYDHSPRSGERGMIITGSTPKNWGGLCRRVLRSMSRKAKVNDLLFIKAWNEWAEGNYLEPDLKYGKGYLEELRKALNDCK